MVVILVVGWVILLGSVHVAVVVMLAVLTVGKWAIWLGNVLVLLVVCAIPVIRWVIWPRIVLVMVAVLLVWECWWIWWWLLLHLWCGWSLC